jgi:hypothetical protein
MKKEVDRLRVALDESQERGQFLTGIVNHLTHELGQLRSMAGMFLDYSTEDFEVPETIPVQLSFLDFEDPDVIDGVITRLTDYDTIDIVGIWQSIAETVTINKYIIVQPCLAVSPAAAVVVGEALLERFEAIAQDITTGARVNRALLDEPEPTGLVEAEDDDEEEPPEPICFRFALPDRRFRVDGNVLKIHSSLYDLSKLMDVEARRLARASFPEYEVIIEGWDAP